MRHERIKEAKEAHDNDCDSLRREDGSELLNCNAMAAPEDRAGRGSSGIAGQRQVVGDTGERTTNGAPEVGRPEKENDVRAIDPFSLPFVMMSEMPYLPACGGIYFAIEDDREVVYIGQSVNIRYRWRTHHTQSYLCDLSNLDDARRYRLAWLIIEDLEERTSAERAFVRRFRPRLNDTFNHDEKPKMEFSSAPFSREKEMLTTKEVAERIGVKYTTVMLWIREGKLIGVVRKETPRGHYWLIPESSIAGIKKRSQGRPRKDSAPSAPVKSQKQKARKKAKPGQ
jgi:excisionase family DNA binding protein